MAGDAVGSRADLIALQASIDALALEVRGYRDDNQTAATMIFRTLATLTRALTEELAPAAPDPEQSPEPPAGDVPQEAYRLATHHNEASAQKD